MFRPLKISLLILWLCRISLAEIPLPTAHEHYQKIKPGSSGLVLLSSLAQELDPSTRQMLMDFVQAVGLPKGLSIPEIDPATEEKVIEAIRSPGLPSTPPIPKEQALALLKQVNWAPLRPQLLEFLVHQSQVLEMIPPKWGNICVPITHDGLLYFLDHLPEDRLLEKIVNLAYLQKGSPRGEYLLEFVAKTPSLQKVGQILARNPDLSPDYRQALQQLENGIRTMTRDELVQFIQEEVGQDLIEKYQVKFRDQILAEASVGAVIRATFVPPGGSVQREAICKVIKPYVLTYLPQDLSIIDGLAEYFTREHDFYKLGSMPLPEMFREIKRALTDEIKTVEEQHNLARARQYYRGNEKILVPELLPLSNEHVTIMEFVHGEKIASAFPGDSKKRAIMARRFSDALTFDVIFSPKEESLFHGDPHAGNVFHVSDDPRDPYRLALLDWGVCGTFPRKERLQLVQLMLGVQLRDARRLRNNVGALLEHGLPESPEQRQRIDALVSRVLAPKPRHSSFDTLGDLLVGLVEEGYATKFSLNLFIKSQITIAGILAELDPNLEQDKYLRQRVAGLVKKEFPKRMLYTLWFPAWNSRNYRSMLSNQDVIDELFSKPKGADKKEPL